MLHLVPLNKFSYFLYRTTYTLKNLPFFSLICCYPIVPASFMENTIIFHSIAFSPLLKSIGEILYIYIYLDYSVPLIKLSILVPIKHCLDCFFIFIFILTLYYLIEQLLQLLSSFSK